LEEESGGNPSQADGVRHSEESPFPFAALVFDGNDCAYARHVE